MRSTSNREKRQCPCAAIVPNLCSCKAGPTASCTCAAPTSATTTCGCAAVSQIAQCRASCKRTCVSTCTHSKISSTCPSSCGLTCLRSCMPQQVVPVRVIMPKLISAEQCLPVCQQSCGKSCDALFTTAECTPVCRQSCEQRCVHLLPSPSINTCSVECWPKCSQQCIGEQQLLLQQNMQLLDSAGVSSIQEQPILVDHPMLAGDLIPPPQQILAGRAPLVSGPIIGSPAPFQQSIQNHPMLTRGQMAPRGESTLISDASSAGMAGQQLPSIMGGPSQVSSVPGSVNVPQEANQLLCPAACMPACDPQCIKKQELLSQQPSQAVPTIKANSRLQEDSGKEFSFGAAKKV
ncbi:hypothetical protein NECAME_12197 [Necator americanus]|uniref:Cysteine rich repeat-containing domain protein n=1 Tax=Necator americanus TaxID=51031 RepID=W2T358_NECAM|nr:hypothetical protein NECAME_12197 [Necator americanus]ETN75671.1 hypothetical protein NECAME_12197 [Necator americanus]